MCTLGKLFCSCLRVQQARGLALTRRGGASPRQPPLAGQARRALLLRRLLLRVWHLERRPLAGGALHCGRDRGRGGWLQAGGGESTWPR